ncbi:MAG: glyoxylate/hydroxypyruvate reductase A [Cyclobacteriaceae bacterium]
MSIAIIAPGQVRSNWARHFSSLDSTLRVEVWPEIKNPNDITCAVVWKHPRGVLNDYPNLQLICSMGAGVDSILDDPGLPNVPITKVVDDQLSRDMSNYIIQGILNFQRDFVGHLKARNRNEWIKSFRIPKQLTIGILGLGELGSDVAAKLKALEFEVCGYSRSPKEIRGVACFSGDEGLDLFLGKSDLLVCLLPLTEATSGILNLELFKKLKPGAYLINVARGAHVNDEDLIAALDEGFISGALLDVFNEEPLPPGHIFWGRQEIMITPHNASITNPKSVAQQIYENFKRIGTSNDFRNLIERNKGY